MIKTIIFDIHITYCKQNIIYIYFSTLIAILNIYKEKHAE
jgi:hypothetical protein